MRYASTGYFATYMESDVNVGATLPPVPVLDLEVVSTDKQQVTLTFTAPGQDLDTGSGK